MKSKDFEVKASKWEATTATLLRCCAAVTHSAKYRDFLSQKFIFWLLLVFLGLCFLYSKSGFFLIKWQNNFYNEVLRNLEKFNFKNGFLWQKTSKKASIVKNGLKFRPLWIALTPTAVAWRPRSSYCNAALSATDWCTLRYFLVVFHSFKISGTT